MRSCVFGSGLVLLFGSCVSPHLYIQAREIVVSYDQATDQADVLVIYKGVLPRGWRLGITLEYIEDVLDGKTSFIHIPTSIEDPLMATVQAKQAQGYIDPKDGLCIAQEATFAAVSTGLERWNKGLREALLERSLSEMGTSQDQERVAFEEQSALLQQAARANWTFLRFEGPQLVLEVPVTANLATELELEQAANPQQMVWWLWPHSFEIASDRVTLAFGRSDQKAWYVVAPPTWLIPIDEKGWYEIGLIEGTMFFSIFEFLGDPSSYHLIHALERRKHTIHRDLTTEGLRNEFLERHACASSRTSDTVEPRLAP